MLRVKPFLIHHSFTPHSSFTSCVEFAPEPRARHLPVRLDRRVADAEDFGRLLDCEPAEKLQLDDARLLRVYGGETFERLVNREQVSVGAFAEAVGLAERDREVLAAALGRVVCARVADEYAPHHVCGDAYELR